MSSLPLPMESVPPNAALLERFDELLEKVRLARPDEDLQVIREAFAFACDRHTSQKRASGDPYIAHPLEVAHLLADMRLDGTAVSTGLLHDVLEDTPTTFEELRRRFGDDVAHCVNGVSKLGRIHYRSAEDRQAETYRKLLLAMIEDIRVILVKLADRLHNMRTLEHLSPERRNRIAGETREIYAPIALRLGMGKMRSELEDLALAYLEPEEYQKIARYIETHREASEEFLAEIRRTLEHRLVEQGVPAEIHGRIKRPSSIARKLRRQRIDLDQVYDLLALRVITDTKPNCYAVLGVIHDEWRPVPDRIKDWVAMPRPNLYQSLHTSVFTQQGQRFEVQIRTHEMHQMAEEGICAHWKYKEGKQDHGEEQGIAWLRQLVEWQQEVQDPGDFLSTLKIDLYPEEVYVFTPQGKLIVLPREATPVDFAYSIHTEVGHSCVGAKVDGRIVPLKYRLSNGELVEIITQKGKEPSADWLKFVKTSRARHKIKATLNLRRRQKAEEIGQKALEREARRVKVPLSQLASKDMLGIARSYGCSQLSDLHAALGFGRYSARQIVAKLLPEAPPEEKPEVEREAPKARRHAPLVVEGEDDVLVYRARCCNPISGEPIVGYITRGKGVAVHSRNCSNVANLMYEAERRIDVAWSRAKDHTFHTDLSIYVEDRPNILNDFTSILSDEKVNITRVDSRSGQGPNPLAIVNMTVELSDVGQLERIQQRLRALPYVREVNRASRGG